MVRETVHSLHRCAASPDAVWSIASDFCADWHPAIATMKRETDRRGSLIRAFTVAGEETLYREQLTYFSDTDRTYAYTHLQGIAQVESYDARLSVAASRNGGSVITLSASLSAPADRAGTIAAGTKAIFDAGLKALAQQAESAPPRASRRRLPAPLPTRQITLDTLPRLALSVTPERAGPLCLFLHGIGGGRSNWDAQLGAAGHSMRAAALDLRGYGDSTLGPAPSTIDDYCSDILRVCDRLGADKLVLCGLSYGAWIATSFAMRHPELLHGLVLSGGCTGMSEAGPEEREAFRLSREVPLNAGQVPADFAPTVVEVIAGPDASGATRATLQESMAAIPAATYRDALNCFTNPLEKFDFSKITMPVLLMTGAHDRLAPPAEIKTVADRIFDAAPCPDVRFEVIGDAGHVCNLESPETYNRLLTGFLSKVHP